MNSDASDTVPDEPPTLPPQPAPAAANPAADSAAPEIAPDLVPAASPIVATADGLPIGPAPPLKPQLAADRRRLLPALLISLVVHVLLLSLSFGNEEEGLPGFDLPWRTRRAEVPDLRAVLTPPPAAAPASAAGAAPSAAEALTPSAVEPAALVRPMVAVLDVTLAVPPDEAPAASDAPVPIARQAPVANDTAEQATSVVEAPTMEAPAQDEPVVATLDALPAHAQLPTLIDLPASQRATWTVPPASAFKLPALRPVPAPVAAASSAASAAPPMRERVVVAQPAPEPEPRPAEADRTAMEAARRQQAAQAEAARLEAVRVEAVRIEAARIEAARIEAARIEAARVEAARQDAIRQEAQRAELARQESARLAAARQEATRQEAARQEATRQEAARQESARQEAARAEATRTLAAQRQAEEDRREAIKRAIGRQLDEEAARRDAAAAARPSANLPYSINTPRRGRLFGRSDANAELVLYAEAWARKIQLNQTFDMLREVVKQPHKQPLVTVALRRDGSVESITFVVGSGVPEVDEAIRRVVQDLAPYQAFPPALARDYDVIEIRRAWLFDMAIRLQ